MDDHRQPPRLSQDVRTSTDFNLQSERARTRADQVAHHTWSLHTHHKVLRGSHTVVFLLAKSWRPSTAPRTSLSDGVTELCGPLRSGEASDPTYSPCPPLEHLRRPRLVCLKCVTGPLCGRRAGLDAAAAFTIGLNWGSLTWRRFTHRLYHFFLIILTFMRGYNLWPMYLKVHRYEFVCNVYKKNDLAPRLVTPRDTNWIIQLKRGYATSPVYWCLFKLNS